MTKPDTKILAAYVLTIAGAKVASEKGNEPLAKYFLQCREVLLPKVNKIVKKHTLKWQKEESQKALKS